MEKTSIAGAHFMARWKVHKLHTFLNENWSVLFDFLPPALRKNYTSQSEVGQKVLALITCGDVGGAEAKWSKSRLEANAKMDKSVLEEMRDNPEEMFEVAEERASKAFRKQSTYDGIVKTTMKNYQNAFDWDDLMFEWKLRSHTRRSWPLSGFLQAELIDRFAGSSWYLFKYKRWGSNEGVERMLLTISKNKGDLGFYTVTINGFGLDEEDVIEFFDGLVCVDTKGRTVFLMKDFKGAFASLTLFTENSSSFSGAEITIGHFSYVSYSMDVHKSLTKSVVVTRQDPTENLTPKVFVAREDVRKEDTTLRAIALYLREKKSNRLSSIQEPIYSNKYFTQWVEKRNGVSFRDEQGDAKGGE